MKYGVGIVGPGRVSTEHIKAYQTNLNSEVRALCGITKEKAKNKADEMGLKCQIFDDLDDMLANSDIDIVSICSPPELHPIHTIKCAEAGKHLVIEKPVALEPKGLFEMLDAVEKARVKTMVCFVLRWNDNFVAMKKRIIDGELGDLVLLNVDYWNGVDRLKQPRPHKYGTNEKEISATIGGGCHAVAMGRYLAGADIEEVSSYGKISDDRIRSIAISLKYNNGLVGNVSATDRCFMPYIFNIYALGTKGSIINNKIYTTNEFSEPNSFKTLNFEMPNSSQPSTHPFKKMIDYFLECVRDDVEPEQNLACSVNVHLACFAADKSALGHGKAIKLSKLMVR